MFRKRRGLREFSPRQRAMLGVAAFVQLVLLGAAQLDLLRRPASAVRGVLA